MTRYLKAWVWRSSSSSVLGTTSIIVSVLVKRQVRNPGVRKVEGLYNLHCCCTQSPTLCEAHTILVCRGLTCSLVHSRSETSVIHQAYQTAADCLNCLNRFFSLATQTLTLQSYQTCCSSTGQLECITPVKLAKKQATLHTQEQNLQVIVNYM